MATNLERFIAKAKELGATLIYAPAVETDPLKNQGSTVLANGAFEGNAKLVKPGLIDGSAVLELDGNGDYVETQWSRVFPAGVTFVWAGKRGGTETEDAICSTRPGEDLIFGFNNEGHIHFTANAFGSSSDWDTSVIGTNGHFGALVWKVGTSVTLYTALYNEGKLTNWGTKVNLGKPGGARELYISHDTYAAFLGQLLPFAVFDKELSEGQVEELRVALHTPTTTSARVLNEPVDDTLFVKLSHSNGRTSRWGGDARTAAGIPRGIKTSTSAPGGHRDASLSLLRDPRREWPDLNLVDDIKIYGRTSPMGRSVFEGQTDEFPSELGDGFGIGVNALGNQVLLTENENFRALYADLGFEHWGDPPLVRKEAIAAVGQMQGKISLSSDSGGLVWDVPNENIAALERTEAAYLAPTGFKVAKVAYRGTRKGVWTKFEAPGLLGYDPTIVGAKEIVALTLDNTIRLASFAEPQALAVLRALASEAVAAGTGVQQVYDRLCVYGDHGLTLRDIEDGLPGLYFHDVLADMLSNWAPDLDYTVAANGTIVPNTSFAMPHFAPVDGTPTVKEAIELGNAYYLNNWAVWDKKRFYWQPWDPSNLTWKVAIAGGAHWTPASRKAEGLLNGLVVYYTDAAGVARTAGPLGSGCDYESAQLQDADPNNPYTRKGRRRWGRLEVDFPLAYPTTAFQVGAVFLAERKMPQRSGTLIIRPKGKGHIPQLRHPTMGPVPIWALRAGDYAELMDWPEPLPFRVIETEYDHDSKTLTAQLDTFSSRMSAIMERVGIRLTGVV